MPELISLSFFSIPMGAFCRLSYFLSCSFPSISCNKLCLCNVSVSMAASILDESSFSNSSEELFLNPVLVLGDLDVDPGNVVLSTSHSPGYDTGQFPQTVDFTDQRSTAVTLKNKNNFI